jgi:hypothetical protein
MSAFGTERTSKCLQAMSAFGGKADMANLRVHPGTRPVRDHSGQALAYVYFEDALYGVYRAGA